MLSTSNQMRHPFQTKSAHSPRNLIKKADRMVVQTTNDEQKLKSIQQQVLNRPQQQQQQQQFPTPRRTRAILVPSHNPAAGSSDDVDSLYDQSTNYTDRTSSSSIPMNTQERPYEQNTSAKKSNDSLANPPHQMEYIQPKKHDVDCASVTSSEWGADSERGESVLQRHNASLKRKCKMDKKYHFNILSGNQGSRSHLMGSIHSLREAAQRMTKSSRSGSRTSINSDVTSKDDQSSNRISTKLSEQQNKTSMYPTWSSG